MLEAQAEITELLSIHSQPVILITENDYQTNFVCTVMLETFRVHHQHLLGMGGPKTMKNELLFHMGATGGP